MEYLANELIGLPIGKIDTWENYLSYAIPRYPPTSSYFERIPYYGNWVEIGSPVLSLKSHDVNMRSPVKGIVKRTDGYSKNKHLMIQPIIGYSISEKQGEIMFREIVDFIHRIEDEIAYFKNPKRISFFSTRIREFNHEYLEKAKNVSSEEILRMVDSLLDEKCLIKSKR